MNPLRKSSSSCYATEMQQRTRRQSRFRDVESSLEANTICNQRTFRSLQQPKRLVSDPIANILSYLGPRNPWPQPVTKDDELWLLDNTAYVTTKKAKDGSYFRVWNAEFVTAVFSQHTSCVVSDAVLQIADMIGLADDDEAKKTIEERLKPFLMDIQPGKQVLALHGETLLKLSPGGRNGISSDVKVIPAAPDGMVTPTTAVVPEGTTGLLQSKTFFADQQGWAVISDIDDTIKITQTSDPIGILRSTFVAKPKPVPGMPELYKFIQSEITSSSPFFYLSASPYNLYPFLRDFRDVHYPHGQLILRDDSWMSIPGLLSNLTVGTQEYKVDGMVKIHGWFPNKKVICIGDSTQGDPEAFGDIYRAHPEWIKAIFIRRVTDIASLGIEEKNKPERFRSAFTGVPDNVWKVFEDPAELYGVVRRVVATG